jgi:ankyrin repeat protein
MWRQFSPLISSVKKDRQDLVKLLIEKGKFDVNSRCNDPNNWSALSVAIANNNHDMANISGFFYGCRFVQLTLPSVSNSKQR